MIARLMCRLFGHDWSIRGITGKYEWCKRCAGRREVCQSCGSSRMYTAVSPPFCLNCDAAHTPMDGTKLTLDPEWLRRNGFATAPEDDPIGWAEGMAPSDVNNSARAMMASVLKTSGRDGRSAES